jgi:hypothetical protein
LLEVEAVVDMLMGKDWQEVAELVVLEQVA